MTSGPADPAICHSIVLAISRLSDPVRRIAHGLHIRIQLFRCSFCRIQIHILKIGIRIRVDDHELCTDRWGSSNSGRQRSRSIARAAKGVGLLHFFAVHNLDLHRNIISCCSCISPNSDAILSNHVTLLRQEPLLHLIDTQSKLLRQHITTFAIQIQKLDIELMPIG